MNRLLEFARKPETGWFSVYQELVERVLARSIELPKLDPDETQFLLAA